MAKTRRQQLEEMLANEPNDPELRYMVAMEHVSEGDHEGAVHCFQALIDVAPDYPPAYHQAGQVLQRLGRIEEAREMLRRGIPVAEKRGSAHAAEEMLALLENLE
jgi:tetratricopeptide (TPR) repeat protein